MKTLFTKMAVLALGSTLFGITAQAQAQEKPEQVEQGSLEWRNLRIKPSFSIYAPYVHLENNSVIAGGTNLEGTYTLGKIADIRAGYHSGSFSGVSAGATWHMVEKTVAKSTKFSVGSGSYYRGTTDFQKVMGPTADIKIGKFMETGSYMRIDGGLDWQTRGRAYYKDFSGNKNGFTSIKLLGTVARFHQSEYTDSFGGFYFQEYVARTGAGGLISALYQRRPWKRVTVLMAMDAGYMKVFGAQDLSDEFVTFEGNTWNLILDIKMGVSIGIF